MTLAPAAPAAPAADETRRRPVWKPLAAAGLGGAVLLATGYGVFASLEATANNTAPQVVSSGDLRLSLTNNGVGFGQVVDKLAPLDKVVRYVTLKNEGSLAAKDLKLQLAATGGPTLISDGEKTRALTVTVDSCSVAWVPGVGSAAGTCGGTVEPVLSTRTLSALTGTTPATAPTIDAPVRAAGASNYLRFTLALPDQTETNANNTLIPADSLTSIQNQTARLTWTFSQVQRVGTTTDS